MKGPKTKDILSGRGLGVVAAFCVLLSGAAFLTHRSAYNMDGDRLGLQPHDPDIPSNRGAVAG